MDKILKTYQVQVNPYSLESGVRAVSLVESPAVEVDFLTLSKDAQISLQLNEEKHIITGPALIADTRIYRFNKQYGEHYIVFSKQTIRDIVEKLSITGNFNFVNIEHDPDQFVSGVTLLESYLTDKTRGVNPKEFESVPDGSWIVSYKVNNIDLWEKIKSGEVKGFSIEGLFAYEQPPIEEPKDEFEDWVKEEYLD